MSLADEVRAEEAQRDCAIAMALAGMEPKERDEWAELLAGPAQSSAIQRVMVRHGYEIGTSTVRRHRRGECGCAK